MLLTNEQAKYLESDSEETFRFVDNGNVSKKEKTELLELDAAFFEVCQYHIITNYEELKK